MSDFSKTRPEQRFHMPLIGGPPETYKGEASSYYSELTDDHFELTVQRIAVQAEAFNVGSFTPPLADNALFMSLDSPDEAYPAVIPAPANPDFRTLYAMMDGALSLVPAGKSLGLNKTIYPNDITYQTSNGLAAAGLILHSSPIALHHLHATTGSMYLAEDVYYLGVDEQQAQAYAEPLLAAVYKEETKDALFEKLADTSFPALPSDPLLSLINKAAQAFLAGEFQIPVHGGDKIGKAVIENGRAELTLWARSRYKKAFLNASSIVSALATNPAFDTARWASHPIFSEAPYLREQSFAFDALIWDNVIHDYTPLIGSVEAEFQKQENGSWVTHDVIVGDQSGYFQKTINFLWNTPIRWRFRIDGQTWGSRKHVTGYNIEITSKNLESDKFLLKYPLYPEARKIDEAANWSQHVSRTNKRQQLESFEGNYDKSQLNILVEGDSWLFYMERHDLYEAIRKSLTASSVDFAMAPLQLWGDTAANMFALGANSQGELLLKYIREYNFDAMVTSFGGNDLLSAGLYNIFDRQKFLLSYIDDGQENSFYFDPYNKGQQSFFIDNNAKNKMKNSFSYLLLSHSWRYFVDGKSTAPDPAAVAADIEALTVTLGLPIDLDVGHDVLSWSNWQGSDDLDAAAAEVLANIPEVKTFPAVNINDVDKFLNAVFSAADLMKRIETVKSALRDFLTLWEAKSGPPVIAHSYCYPFYNDQGTHYGATIVEGPWVHQRLKEAGLRKPVLRQLCIKALLDAYVNHVLEPLKTDFPNTFDYIDWRHIAAAPEFWRDEIHLSEAGYDSLAPLLISKLKSIAPGKF